MGTGIIKLLVGKLLPIEEFRVKKGKGSRKNLATSIVRTVGYWGLLAILLYAMSKGVLSLNDVEEVIKTIKE